MSTNDPWDTETIYQVKQAASLDRFTRDILGRSPKPLAKKHSATGHSVLCRKLLRIVIVAGKPGGSIAEHRSGTRVDKYGQTDDLWWFDYVCLIMCFPLFSWFIGMGSHSKPLNWVRRAAGFMVLKSFETAGQRGIPFMVNPFFLLGGFHIWGSMKSVQDVFLIYHWNHQAGGFADQGYHGYHGGGQVHPHLLWSLGSVLSPFRPFVGSHGINTEKIAADPWFNTMLSLLVLTSMDRKKVGQRFSFVPQFLRIVKVCRRRCTRTCITWRPSIPT